MSRHMDTFDDSEFSDLCAVLDRDADGIVVRKLSLHKAIVLRQSPVLKNDMALFPGNAVMDFVNESQSFKDAVVPLFKFLYSGRLEIEDSLFALCWSIMQKFQISDAGEVRQRLVAKLKSQTDLTLNEFQCIAPYIYAYYKDDELAGLLDDLARHLVALLRDFFTVKLDDFAYEHLQFVPRDFLISCLDTVAQSLSAEFDSIFIGLVDNLGHKHAFIHMVAPLVPQISVAHLKTYSKYVYTFDGKTGSNYFEQKIKDCVNQHFDSIPATVLDALPLGFVKLALFANMQSLLAWKTETQAVVNWHTENHLVDVQSVLANRVQPILLIAEPIPLKYEDPLWTNSLTQKDSCIEKTSQFPSKICEYILIKRHPFEKYVVLKPPRPMTLLELFSLKEKTELVRVNGGFEDGESNEDWAVNWSAPFRCRLGFRRTTGLFMGIGYEQNVSLSPTISRWSIYGLDRL